MGLSFDKVGGLDDQLNDIVRRVLASRYVRWLLHFCFAFAIVLEVLRLIYFTYSLSLSLSLF